MEKFKNSKPALLAAVLALAPSCAQDPPWEPCREPVVTVEHNYGASPTIIVDHYPEKPDPQPPKSDACPRVDTEIPIAPLSSNKARLLIGPEMIGDEYCELLIEGTFNGPYRTHKKVEISYLEPSVAGEIAKIATSVQYVLDYLAENFREKNLAFKLSAEREKYSPRQITEYREFRYGNDFLFLTEMIHCGGERLEAVHHTRTDKDETRFVSEVDWHVSYITKPTSPDFEMLQMGMTEIPHPADWLYFDMWDMECK